MITELDVDVPVRTAYNQWTQFEDFPLFMDHVEDIRQLNENTVRWRVKIAGVTREWDAKIVEQTPDQRVAWAAIDGTDNAGSVDFHALGDDRTRIVLTMEMDPHGVLEQIADKGGFVRDRAKKDLRDFKAFIERRGRETGEYRETIRRDEGVVSGEGVIDVDREDELARRDAAGAPQQQPLQPSYTPAGEQQPAGTEGYGGPQPTYPQEQYPQQQFPQEQNPQEQNPQQQFPQERYPQR